MPSMYNLLYHNHHPCATNCSVTVSGFPWYNVPHTPNPILFVHFTSAVRIWWILFQIFGFLKVLQRNQIAWECFILALALYIALSYRPTLFPNIIFSMHKKKPLVKYLLTFLSPVPFWPQQTVLNWLSLEDRFKAVWPVVGGWVGWVGMWTQVLYTL